MKDYLFQLVAAMVSILHCMGCTCFNHLMLLGSLWQDLDELREVKEHMDLLEVNLLVMSLNHVHYSIINFMEGLQGNNMDVASFLEESLLHQDIRVAYTVDTSITEEDIDHYILHLNLLKNQNQIKFKNFYTLSLSFSFLLDI